MWNFPQRPRVALALAACAAVLGAVLVPLLVPRVLARGLTLAAKQVALASNAADPAARLTVRVVSSDAEVHGYSYSTGGEGGIEWMLLEGPGNEVTMHGHFDEDRIEQLTALKTRPVMWSKLAGREWLITDRTVLADVLEANEPVKRLGELLGRNGGKLGSLGGRLGSLGGRLGALAAREASSSRADTEREREREIIQREMDRIELQMKPIEAEQTALSKRMDAATKRTSKEIRAIVERAIREGKAERFHAGA